MLKKCQHTCKVIICQVYNKYDNIFLQTTELTKRNTSNVEGSYANKVDITAKS